MFDFHIDHERYFQMQKISSREYIIPFIEEVYPLKPDFRVLEIGCSYCGVLDAFLERGCKGVGVDLDAGALEDAQKRLSKYVRQDRLLLLSKNIYHIDSVDELGGKFDLILLKDVIEHIPDQKRLLEKIKTFLRPEGRIFFGFPPWQMPFGGHQQMCQNSFLSHLPYFHLLPAPLYKAILKASKENPDAFLEIKKTGISIERFERMVRNTAYTIVNQRHYFINPIYQYKFKLKVRKQAPVIRAIPYLRDFFTTSVFYLIQNSSLK